MGVIEGSYNAWLVCLSVIVSILGSYAALRAARLIVTDPGGRPFWIGIAACALGGSAIWSMHFIGMLAFDLGLPVRYDLALTAGSLLLVVGITAIGFHLVASGAGTLGRCCLAGFITGLGVAGMHYTGMAAMRAPAAMSWNGALVVASVAIAVAAASAALWLAFTPRGRWQTIAGAVVMGCAVCGMHYTGMAAVTFRHAAAPDAAMGAISPDLLAYSVFLVAVFTVVVVLTVADTPVRRLSRRVRALSWRGSVGVALWLAVAAIPLLAGWWAHTSLDRTLRDRLAEELQTVLQADVAALDIWIERQRHTAEVQAQHPEVASLARRMIAGGPASATLLARLEDYLATVIEAYRYREVLLYGPQGRVTASATRTPVAEDDALLPFIRHVLGGRSSVSLPRRMVADSADDAQAEAPLRMYAAAPIRTESGEPVAALAFGIDPEDEFFRILTIARSGVSGETYAFDRDGLLISPSRFVDDLVSAGAARGPAVSGVPTVRLSDPGGNLLRGYVPDPSAGQRPLTRMARAAVTGQSGLDVEGYRDYRGVPVVGAWTWLAPHGFGVATEIDVEEAFGRLSRIRQGLWALLGLLATGAIGLVIGHGAIRRLHRDVQRAARLGQYTLEKRIGEGGMGVVYRARHAMLQRPTAVKLLQPDRAGYQAVARFEREVQLTARLAHPNTIAVYDYGRTPDGTFYYAMEYLTGHTLDQLVARHGAQPEGRVIHILRQACGSLAEAHGVGLIHRDVKPGNLMLCERGGLLDVLKVLDFGLVKDVTPQGDATLTHDGTFTGTPSYISPEAVMAPGEVDGRSDLYCLGAVGYFLLTGRHVFEGETAMAVIAQHLHAEPPPPSARADVPLSADLEAVIMQCLHKAPDRRPSSASALAERLAGCVAAGWTQADARRWRDAHIEAEPTPSPDGATVTSSIDVALSVDIRGRLESTGNTGRSVEGLRS